MDGACFSTLVLCYSAPEEDLKCLLSSVFFPCVYRDICKSLDRYAVEV